eukprot:m.180406 g.180406  ORF g.180406 m.180406 type:complete len:492 (-) comp15000_c0_seq1:150-1625(-)
MPISLLKRFLLHPVTRRVFRVTRVGVLGGGLVYSGYLLGSLTVLKDPKRFELEYLQQALSRHAKTHETTHFATVAESWRPTRSPGLMVIQEWVEQFGFSEDTHRTPRTPASAMEDGDHLGEDLDRLHRVGLRMLNASREIIAAQLKEYQKSAETGHLFIDYKDYDMNRLQLEEADRLLTLEEWKFTYLHSNDVDCFVNHYAPRRIFITKGMLDLCRQADNDAALAMAIGHELSHSILNHGENDEWLDVGLKIGQLMVLSLLDPTGIITLGLEAGLVFTSPLARTHYSQSQTVKADAMSLKIAAHACYKPDNAIKFLHLLHHRQQGISAAAPSAPDMDDLNTMEVAHAAAGSGRDMLTAAANDSISANMSPQPSQMGFGDGMLQRLLANTPQERRAKAMGAMSIAYEIYEEKGCTTWRRAADEFLTNVRNRQRKCVHDALEDVGMWAGADPLQDDGSQRLSAADVGGIMVGGLTITGILTTAAIVKFFQAWY